LPIASEVKLSVYDLLGREVAVLVNEMKHAGTYTVKWDARQTDGGQASRLSSGVYFYTITAGSYRETKRMILIK
jgi:flagellar hook assembly protein FlgD